ncbi:MAG: aldo/keto reductase, partial [Acidimicrobiia bacterium]
CDGSLERLRVEQIPLYQLHRPDPDVPLEDSVGALVELKDHGKIRHIGLSNVTEDQLATAQQMTPVVSVQNRYSPTDRRSEAMLDRCESESIAFLPWAPIEAGSIGDDGTVARIAAAQGATAHQVALAWLLTRSPVMLPIPGTGSVAHLEENMQATSVVLTPEQVAELSSM